MNQANVLLLTLLLAPLVGSAIAGILGKVIGPTPSHRVTILGVGISLLLSIWLALQFYLGQIGVINITLYHWLSGANLFPFDFEIGILLDELTITMLLVVNFVSLLVHVYSIGYMHNDPGYARFFSYISLFTFAMLLLISANNFLQLFIGWEGVGLASYLLIGFWYHKESAIQGSLKAFLVNRVGDFGFIIGIALVMTYTGSLSYETVFARIGDLAHAELSILSNWSFPVIGLICFFLFIGAMGKSAQVPLHVWLPESMEGPTPISALIHAATMVTAGVFLVARLSPIYELSPGMLSFIAIIGATGAFFTGLLGVVMNDIKRVVAYSTLSQLGYMMVAMGVSAYGLGVFHLVTHAAFKAVLFLGAGSVILAMHHEQDIRKMGGLYRYMPITYFTFLIGTLALVAIPPFAGFYSKDLIIEAAAHSQGYGHTYVYYCVLLGAFLTALYSFRLLFLTFHTKERFDEQTRSHVHESPWVVWLPLVLLAVPSLLAGVLLVGYVLTPNLSWFGQSMVHSDMMQELTKHYHGPFSMILHAASSPAFWVTLLGIATAWLFYIQKPDLPGKVVAKLNIIYRILVNKYGIDDFNQIVFVRGTRGLGQLFYTAFDRVIIDGLIVNGSSLVVKFVSDKLKQFHSGLLNHYMMVMSLGLFALVMFVYFTRIMG